MAAASKNLARQHRFKQLLLRRCTRQASVLRECAASSLIEPAGENDVVQAQMLCVFSRSSRIGAIADEHEAHIIATFGLSKSEPPAAPHPAERHSDGAHV